MRTAGDLKQRVTILARVPVIDGGVSRDDWRTVLSCRAEILHQSARAFYTAGADYGEAVIVAHIRTPRSITLTDGARIIIDQTYWDVVDVVPDKPIQGFTELRARRCEREGLGA